ncbi:MAG TPA: SMC-Scp complex subunit ScpB [Symbiobacteriaceae bacterium]|jgi:segregation and condensation protein B|nr:SMC-Scp complex subunit ScpB [Symbiobacteriaceae bacterium]
MIWNHGKAILEAILLASPEPLSVKRIAEVIGLDEKDARILVDDLKKEYSQPGRGLLLQELAGGYVLTTRPEYGEYVEKLLAPKGKGLSHAALETLAIVAYRQPITKAEIEGVRGVKVDRSIETLLERGLIREVGRKDGPGRPILYGTTKDFLTYFGLKDLSDLPPLTVDTSDAQLILRGREVSAALQPDEVAAAAEHEGAAEPKE